jgi:hypothetical protein
VGLPDRIENRLAVQGTRVRGSRTVASTPSWASRSAAWSDSWTIRPRARMVRSRPWRWTLAWPKGTR